MESGFLCKGGDAIIEELGTIAVLPPGFCNRADEGSMFGVAADCEANHHLGEIADRFISRCRQASIRREFPGELLTETLGTINMGKSAKHKRAWKLLNDHRFQK